MVLVTDALTKMAAMGESVVLDWGEDNGLWECSWITGGNRFTGMDKDIRKAVVQVLEKAGVTVP